MRKAIPIRLPADLERDARQRADRLGISLNALACVALDAFLRAPPVAPAPVDLAPSGFESGHLPVLQTPQAPQTPAKLPRAERRRLKRQQSV